MISDKSVLKNLLCKESASHHLTVICKLYIAQKVPEWRYFYNKVKADLYLINKNDEYLQWNELQSSVKIETIVCVFTMTFL